MGTFGNELEAYFEVRLKTEKKLMANRNLQGKKYTVKLNLRKINKNNEINDLQD